MTPVTGAVLTDALAVHQVGADAAATRATALVRDRLAAGTPATEVAVLARVNSALLPVQVALTEAGIPHTAPLDASVLGRTGVRTALAYVRIALDLDRIRRDDLLDTLNRPSRKVKSAVVPHLRRSNRWSLRQLEQVGDVLEGPHRERFADYLGDLHHLATAVREGASTSDCLRLVRDRIGLGEAMDALDASRTRPEGSSHGDDLDALAQLAHLHPDPATFREWLTDRLRVPADPDGVTLSTVHRVKGMEWDHVIVFAANTGLFPHRLADDVEEERRVFHVALTRCRAGVAVVADRGRTSPFVAELSRAAERPPRQEAAPPVLPARVDPSRRSDGAVVAAAGVEVTLAGGFAGRIAAVGRDGVTLVVPEEDGGVLELTVAFGEAVAVDGQRAPLVPPARTTTATPAAAGRLVAAREPDPDDDLFQALRAWRARVAAEAGMPPYLVFHDRHLQLIAGRKPASVRELAACPGVGPAKLERYADDLLDLVDQYS